MKNNKKQLQKGFSLLETIITMSIFFIILFGVYTMIKHYGDVSKTEHSRMTMQQESRFMVSSFADEIKEAGAVLTIANTGGFLAATPFFNGLYPLNSTYSPDGIIVATGDPEAVTVLTAEFDPADTTDLPVANANVAAYDASAPYEVTQWTAGDRGIVIGTTGYYVFTVTGCNGADTISVRNTPAYCSGLLSTGSYSDTALGNARGDAITYSIKSPVIRLTNFSIYVFRDIDHPARDNEKIRQLIRITDTHGVSDPLAENSGAEWGVISENIWDLQISYKAYEDFTTADRSTTIDPNHLYYTEGTAYTSATDALAALMQDIQGKKLKQIDITILAIADELGGQGKPVDSTDIQPFGDNDTIGTGSYLPTRKFSYKLFSFSVEPRNFNISL